MLNQDVKKNIEQAIKLLKSSDHTTAFTGAGISVESGVPPFRGQGGLWSKIDPIYFDIRYFNEHPNKSWTLIKEVFYDFFNKAKPNLAHLALTKMQEKGLLKTIITQNIDNLHHEAGSKDIIEFHGNSRKLVCTACGKNYDFAPQLIEEIPPKCKECSGILKPDFVFFGEPIPELASKRSFAEAELADVFVLIGTTGEVQPASMIPIVAKQKGTTIIEINVQQSSYTEHVTDVFLHGKATEIMDELAHNLLS